MIIDSSGQKTKNRTYKIHNFAKFILAIVAGFGNPFSLLVFLIL